MNKRVHFWCLGSVESSGSHCASPPQVWCLSACRLLFSQNAALYFFSCFFNTDFSPLRKSDWWETVGKGLVYYSVPLWCVHAFIGLCVSLPSLCLVGAEAQTLGVLCVLTEAPAQLPPESHWTKSIRNHVAGRQKHRVIYSHYVLSLC